MEECMTRPPDSVLTWIAGVLEDAVQKSVDDHDWAEVDLSEYLEIDYSQLSSQIDEDELASKVGESVSEGIDWEDVVSTMFREWMDDNVTIESCADHLEGDLGRMIESAVHEHTSLWRTAVEGATKFNKGYQESLNGRLEALENRKSWWRFW
jgi:hypothetical protein